KNFPSFLSRGNRRRIGSGLGRRNDGVGRHRRIVANFRRRTLFLPHDWRDEAVATTRQRFDETWRLSPIADRGADFLNAEVHPLLIIHKSFIAPDFLLNLLARHDLTRLNG